MANPKTISNIHREIIDYLISSDNAYLCHDGHDYFVSRIGFIPSNKLSQPHLANYDNGCVYVDNIRTKTIVPIDELKEMYLLQQTPDGVRTIKIECCDQTMICTGQ